MKRLRYVFLALGLSAFAFFVYQVGLDVIVKNLRSMGWAFPAVLGVWLTAYAMNATTFALILGEDRERVGPVRLLGR